MNETCISCHRVIKLLAKGKCYRCYTRIRQREYYQRNKEKEKLRAKKWYLTNHGKAYSKEYHKRYYQANKKKINSYYQENYLKDPEKVKAYIKNWISNNQNKWRAINRNLQYKRRQKSISNKLTFQDQESIIKRDNSTCVYCNTHLLRKQITFDHIIPLNPMPGQRVGNNNINNLAVSCFSCNCSKNNKSLAHWFSSYYCQTKNITPHTINNIVWILLNLSPSSTHQEASYSTS